MLLQEIAESWAAADKQKEIPGGGSVQHYKQVNADESVQLADAFLSSPFLYVSV